MSTRQTVDSSGCSADRGGPAITKIGHGGRKLVGNAIRFVILYMSCPANNGRVRVEMARTCAAASTGGNGAKRPTLQMTVELSVPSS